MAEITSAQAGNWSDTATWVGGVVPGDGDTAVVNHAVTVDVNTTVGASDAAGTVAITVKTGKSLTINADLRCRGNLLQERGSTVTVNGPSTLFLDSATEGVRYAWTCNMTGSGVPKFEIKSVDGQRGIVNGNGGRGGANGVASPYSAGGVWAAIDFDGAILKNLGSSSVRAIHSYMHDSTCSLSIKNVLIDNCGEVYLQINNGAIQFVIDKIDFRNCLASNALDMLGSQDKTTGTRKLSNLTLYSDSTTRSIQNSMRDLEYENIILHNSRFVNSMNTRRNIFGKVFSSRDEFTTPVLQTIGKTGCIVEDSIFVSNVTNPHIITDNNSDQGQDDNVVRRCIADAWGRTAGDWGELIANTFKRFEVYENLVINGRINLYSIASTTGTINANRNTIYDCNGMNIGETVATPDGLEKYSSNLMVSLPGGMFQLSAFTALDDASFIDYNAFWDMQTASNLDHPVIAGNPRSYMGAESQDDWFQDGLGFNGTAGRGLNDVYVNPQFVDSSRTVKKWGQLFDPALDTVQDIGKLMVRLNGYDFEGTPASPVEGATVEACWEWVRAGFAPTNQALKGAGEGGVDIGAMDVLEAISGVSFSPFRSCAALAIGSPFVLPIQN